MGRELTHERRLDGDAGIRYGSAVHGLAIRDEEFQIGNNRGGINGWIGARSIFGKLVKVED